MPLKINTSRPVSLHRQGGLCWGPEKHSRERGNTGLQADAERWEEAGGCVIHCMASSTMEMEPCAPQPLQRLTQRDDAGDLKFGSKRAELDRAAGQKPLLWCGEGEAEDYGSQ